jgi:hypothetical protein
VGNIEEAFDTFPRLVAYERIGNTTEVSSTGRGTLVIRGKSGGNWNGLPIPMGKSRC